MKIGVISHLFTGKRIPVSGIYVKEELDSLTEFAEICLIAPLPNQRWFGEIHRETMQSDYPVARPFVLADSARRRFSYRNIARRIVEVYKGVCI